MAGSKIKSFRNTEDRLNTMCTTMNSYYTAIANASTELSKMMKGDGESAYWQGDLAVKFYRKLTNHIGSLIDIAYYNNQDDLKKIAKQVAIAGKKKDGKNRNVTDYTNRFRKYSQLVDYKFATDLPSTVSADETNDIDSAAAQRCIQNLLGQLREVRSREKSLANGWEYLATQTKGSLKSTCERRANGLQGRVSQMDQFIDTITQEAIPATINYTDA